MDGRCVLLDRGRLDIVAESDPRCRTAQRYDLKGQLLLPGFIDSQVNGGGGVLFNDAPSIEAIRAIGAAHRRFGTTGFLPTLISEDLDVVARAIAAVQGAIQAGVPGVLGIHIEGPFLNVARKGVHDPAKLRELDRECRGAATSLRGGGKTLVTLAPEMTTPDIIQSLVKSGVVVVRGHTNATYAEIVEALQHGLTGFTHLFNAMSQLTGREPGVVGAALGTPTAGVASLSMANTRAPWHCESLSAPSRITVSCSSRTRCRASGTNATSFNLQGRKITVAGPICLDEDGRLAGSNIDMASCVRNAMKLLHLPLPEAVRMASLHPAEFLGIAHDTGRIRAGYRANLVLADDDLNVLETWIDGQTS